MEMEDFLKGTFAEYSEVRSLIKWAGGKGRVMPLLKPYLLSKKFSETKNFYEPFCGSLTVSLKLNRPYMFLNDKNRNLINFFEQVKSNSEKLYKKIIKLKNECNAANDKESFYYRVREDYNSQYVVNGNAITNAAYFWFLNKTGFNGMYRETKSGKFNIPFGSRDCPELDYNHVIQVSNAIQNANFSSLNFDSFCDKIESDSSVYLDPPYLPYSETSNFTSYLGKGFGIDLHIKLSKIMKRLNRKGIPVIMSNSKSLLTEDIYGSLKDFSLKEISVSRSISAASESRKKAGEYIIYNFTP